MIKSNLRILMAEHRIDGVSELMKRSNLSRNAINRLYKGDEEAIEATTLKTLIALCKVFNCKLSDLLEYIPDESKKEQ
jgi:putative transcriptional regulator